MRSTAWTWPSKMNGCAASVAAPKRIEYTKWRMANPKIAAVVTSYYKYSHAQHIVDRFLDGYGWNGAHHYPPMDLVSLYVNQVGQTDLSKERLGRHPSVKSCKTIAEALTLGGDKLAVDGVVLVGEHGNYPRTEKGQVQYPR